MNEWPEGWFRGEKPAPGKQPGAHDPTVALPAKGRPGGGPAGAPPGAGPGSPADAGGWGAGPAETPGADSAFPARADSAFPARADSAFPARADGAYPARAAGANDPVGMFPVGAAGGGAPGAPGRLPPRSGDPSDPGGPGGQGWPSQPPLRSGAAPAPYQSPPPPLRRRPGRPRRRGRRVVAVLAAILAVLVVVSGGLYFYLDSKLTRVNVLTGYSGRPAASAGQNWLITGSDSRQGLTRSQERRLATGFDVSGHRSDTILLLHIPANGGPAVLISLPRDSYVDIPGYGMNKINAAYSFGGPKLLARTVQNATGLRIDHYMGIGFGGLVNVVNDVGGVTLCFPHRLHDQAAGLRLRKGCQTLNGAQALGFVRTRHQFAGQDLQRVQNQRVFLRALLSKVTSPGTMLNPFASVPAAFGAAQSLQVDQGTHLYQLIEVAFALRNPETTTVPIANANYLTPAGDAVLWDRTTALRLFNDLRTDQRVPRSLLTGSRLAG